MPCCEISDRAQMSKTIIAVRHFGLGLRWSQIARNYCKANNTTPRSRYYKEKQVDRKKRKATRR